MDVGMLLIGSAMCSDIVKINTVTGVVIQDGITNDRRFLKKYYPAIIDASADCLLGLINSNDDFKDSIEVFTVKGGSVVTKLAETFGWPNVTNDGEMMYENTFFKTKIEAIKAGIGDSESAIRLWEDEVSVRKKRTEDAESKLSKSINERYTLELEFLNLGRSGE